MLIDTVFKFDLKQPLPDENDPDLIDPYCDPTNPVTITFDDIKLAHKYIQDAISPTACESSKLSESLDIDLYLKYENLHRTHSFKERGARNVLEQLSDEQRVRGVVSASAGNHAQAIAYHGSQMGIPVVVVMPNIAPEVKIANCRRLGARVLIMGNFFDEAKRHALKLAKANKMVYINGFDHPQILAGQGTIGLEIMQQVPDVDAIIVPCGGGGLISGIVVAVKHLNPNVQIIGAESAKCNAFAVSLKHGKPTYVEPRITIADGLAVSLPGCNTVYTCKDLVDRMVEVDEEIIHCAMLRLLEQERSIVEGGGAVALAALMTDQLPELAGKKVVAILSGGNVDTSTLIRTLERALFHDGRMVQFSIVIPDRPNSMSTLCQELGRLRVNIFDISHQRPWTHASAYKTEVIVSCECLDVQHQDMLRRRLDACYKHVTWHT